MSETSVSLWCFLHDATIHGIFYNPVRPWLEMEVRLGYPRIEESAFRTITCKMAGALAVERLDPNEHPGPDDLALLISECSAEGFEVFDANLKVVPNEAALDIEGYTIDSADYLRLILRGPAPLWYHEGQLVTLEFMISMGERQWDLWQAKAGPELD